MTKPKEEKVADATVTDGETQETEEQEAETTETEEESEETLTELSDEEKEHKERSALGRRIGAIERNTNERLDNISNSVERLIALQSGDSAEESEEEVVTRKTLREELQTQRNEEKENQSKYHTAYNSAIDQAGMDEDEGIHGAIVKELEANFNFVHSTDGARDAEVNYNKASRAYFKKRLSLQKKKVPIKGQNGEKPPLGSGVEGDKIEVKDKGTDSDLPPLDDAAKDYIKRRGLSEEQVKKYLKADLPLSITGIKNEVRK